MNNRPTGARTRGLRWRPRHAAGARHRSPRPPRRRILPVGIVVAWIVIGAVLAGHAGRLGEVLESGATAALPTDAASKQVSELIDDFGDEPSLPAIVVWTSPSALTRAQLADVAAQAKAWNRELSGELTTSGVLGPIPSKDGKAVEVVVPIAGLDTEVASEAVERMRAGLSPPAGLQVAVTGPAGFQADMTEALGAVDLMLVFVTCAFVLVILLVVYRSVLLPFLVIAVGGLALGCAQGALYFLAKAGWVDIGSEVQGIVSVLVLGCATDYGMLLISRFEERLRAGEGRADAMRAALRGTWEPVVASASTVSIGLLTLLLSSLGLNRQLGPAAAVGVVIAMVAMLTLLPALLLLCGAAAFWPRRHVEGVQEGARAPRRVDALIADRPRAVWVIATLVLLAGAAAVPGLRTGTLTDRDMVIGADVQSRTGQEMLDAHFDDAAGAPTIVVVPRDQAQNARRIVAQTPGVQAVTLWAGPAAQAAAQAGRPVDAPPVVADGRVRLDATLHDAPETQAAADTVVRLRDRLAPLGDSVLVGGPAAIRVDFNDAAHADIRVLVLLAAIVFVIIVVLLRAVVAGVVIIASVALSYFAALGVSALVFDHVFHFPGVDATFPIHAFVFLVALGVDYSIFLMSRVRECVLELGPREGVLAGTAQTSRVITGAGVVLAATFAALGLIPLVLMAELAFIVAFGVLLDTFVVRALLVPAVAVDLGPAMWWPNRRLMTAGRDAELGVESGAESSAGSDVESDVGADVEGAAGADGPATEEARVIPLPVGSGPDRSDPGAGRPVG